MGEQQSKPKITQNEKIRASTLRTKRGDNYSFNYWKKVARLPQTLQCTASSSEHTMYIYGGCDWAFDIKTQNPLIALNLLDFTWKFINLQIQPTHRTRHISFMYKNRIYIYGGYTSSGPSSDLWCFLPEKISWEKIVTKLDYSIHDHAGIVYKEFLYIYGGQINIKKPEFPFRRLNLETLNWENLHLKEDIPDKIISHSATLVNDRIVIFGGIIEKEPQNDVYIYNLITSSWYILDCKGEIPRPRFHHLANTFGDYLFVVGGSFGKNLYINSDIYVLDIYNEVWSILQTSGELPSARSQGFAFSRRNSFFVSVGYGGKLVLDDVQELQIETKIVPKEIYESMNSNQLTDCIIVCGKGEIIRDSIIRQLSRTKTLARRATGINKQTKWIDSPIIEESLDLVKAVRESPILKDIHFQFEDEIIKSPLTPNHLFEPESPRDSPKSYPKYKNLTVKKTISSPLTKGK